MIFMSLKNHYKKIFLVAVILFVAINFCVPHLALAADSTQSAQPNFFTSPITGAVYYVATVIDEIMSFAVMGTAALVRLGLQFNDNIFTSPAVQTGFSVSLAIANLGFVLGIIIIALATILRNQTYGIKQLLWKLVFMAILVNFGLVITGPIVGFAGSMSNYFVNATSPSDTTGGYEGYATTMAQAFAPQAVSSGVQQAGCSDAAAGTGVAAICNTAAATTKKGSDSDSFTQSLLALVFGIAFLALTAFTFLCIAILLIIRYLMLAGLLIVLPLAWLTWIFPKFDNSYSKWWNTFVKWTFFPPLALFFIYLAFITATNTSSTSTAYLKQAAGLPSSNSGVESALAYQTGLGGPIQQAADEVLLVGLTIMGLMFASSLAGKAGATAVNVGASASKAVGGYVGKQTKKGARLAYQKTDKGVQSLSGMGITQRLQEGKIPGLGYIPLGRRAASLAGRGISNISNNEELVKNAQKKVPKSWDEAKSNLAGSMNREDQFAHIAFGIKEGKLKADDMVNGTKVADILDNQDLVARYGQGKLTSDADKLFMSTTNSRNADRAIAKGEKEVVVGKEIKDENGNTLYKSGDKIDPKILKKEAERDFYQTTPKGDFSKGNVNGLFSPKAASDNPDEFANRLKNIAEYRPEVAADLMKKMNGPTLQKFNDTYVKVLRSVIDDTNSQINTLTTLGVRTQEQTDELGQLTSKLNRSKNGSIGVSRAFGAIFGSASIEGKNGDEGGAKNDDGDKK
jgi:hypothetical protein